MSDDRLQRASEQLRQASAAADDAESQRRLYDLSDRLAALAAAGDGDGRPSSAAADEAPDGDDLMQHLHALGELRETTSGDVAERVDAALETVRTVREEGEN